MSLRLHESTHDAVTVLFFADRFDHFATQGGDGYASYIGGARGVATDAMAAWYGERGLGTIPHALIVAYGGDTALVTERFNHYYPEIPAIALVDFDNLQDQGVCRIGKDPVESQLPMRLDQPQR